MGLATTSGDFHNDGDVDVVIISNVKGKDEANIYFSLRANKKLNNPKYHSSIPSESNNNPAITIMDIDKDGDLDLVVAAKQPNENKANIYTLLYANNRLYPPKYHSSIPMAPNTSLSLSLIDIANDKKSDLLIGAQDPESLENKLYVIQYANKKLNQPREYLTIPNN